jgi:signal transduction histidine kinase
LKKVKKVKKIRISAQVIGDRSAVISRPSVADADHCSLITDHPSCRRILRLTVEDDGPGIPMDIQERVFDPFFTTKDRTRHSGLGLWFSRSIILEHGGEMSVESPSMALPPSPGGSGAASRAGGAVGQWTRVHVELPVAPEPSDMISNEVSKAT